MPLTRDRANDQADARRDQKDRQLVRPDSAPRRSMSAAQPERRRDQLHLDHRWPAAASELRPMIRISKRRWKSPKRHRRIPRCARRHSPNERAELALLRDDPGHARRQLGDPGGAPGLRDKGCCDPPSTGQSTSGSTSRRSWIRELAAAYGFGLREEPCLCRRQQAHRVAWRCYTFLGVNEHRFRRARGGRRAMILALAAGEVSEESLTRWIRDNWPKA